MKYTKFLFVIIAAFLLCLPLTAEGKKAKKKATELPQKRSFHFNQNSTAAPAAPAEKSFGAKIKSVENGLARATASSTKKEPPPKGFTFGDSETASPKVLNKTAPSLVNDDWWKRADSQKDDKDSPSLGAGVNKQLSKDVNMGLHYNRQVNEDDKDDNNVSMQIGVSF